jgi:hypothetical protein
MAQVKYQDEEGKTKFVCEFHSVDNFYSADNLSSALQIMRRRNTDGALQIAEMMRAAGFKSAIAITNKGEPLETVKDAPIATQYQPVTYRGVTPIKIRDGMWRYQFTDPWTGNVHSVQGASPQEAIDKLFGIPHEIYLRHIATLPPEQPAEPQPVAQAPTNPNRSTDGRVLRAGDCTWTQPERRLPVEDIRLRNIEAEYQAFLQTCSAQQMKDRAKTDAGFNAFINFRPPTEQ